MAGGSNDRKQSRLHDLDLIVRTSPARVEVIADLGALVTVIVVTCRTVRAAGRSVTTPSPDGADHQGSGGSGRIGHFSATGSAGHG